MRSIPLVTWFCLFSVCALSQKSLTSPDPQHHPVQVTFPYTAQRSARFQVFILTVKPDTLTSAGHAAHAQDPRPGFCPVSRGVCAAWGPPPLPLTHESPEPAHHASLPPRWEGNGPVKEEDPSVWAGGCGSCCWTAAPRGRLRGPPAMPHAVCLRSVVRGMTSRQSQKLSSGARPLGSRPGCVSVPHPLLQMAPA